MNPIVFSNSNGRALYDDDGINVRISTTERDHHGYLPLSWGSSTSSGTNLCQCGILVHWFNCHVPNWGGGLTLACVSFKKRIKVKYYICGTKAKLDMSENLIFQERVIKIREIATNSLKCFTTNTLFPTHRLLQNFHRKQKYFDKF